MIKTFFIRYRFQNIILFATMIYYLLAFFVTALVAAELGFVPTYDLPMATKIVLMLGGGFSDALITLKSSAGMFKYAGSLLLFLELTRCLGTGKGLCETAAILLNEVFVLWTSWAAGGALAHFASSRSNNAWGRLFTIFILFVIILILNDRLAQVCI
jgi:hypothetical protein